MSVRRSDSERPRPCDTGPGIPAERRHRIFDRFYRGVHDRSGESRGAGLGLAIAKWAVEAHLGDLSYEPAPDGGSVFRITLHTAATSKRAGSAPDTTTAAEPHPVPVLVGAQNVDRRP